MENIIIYITIIILICFILYLLRDKINDLTNIGLESNNINRRKETKYVNNSKYIDKTNNYYMNSNEYPMNPLNSYIINNKTEIMDRYINPLTYPKQSLDIYVNNRNVYNPFHHARNFNIGVPINIKTRGPIGLPQQVGTINKVNSNHTEVLPLFGRKKYPNGSNNWEYYTLAGDYGVKLNVVTRKKGEQLSNNDIVFIKGYNEITI